MTLFKEFWYLTSEMAPYLILGFVIAGFFHVYFPKDFVRKHLARPGIGSLFKSVLMGVPLPLCSCGVIPVANQLKKDGASNGSIMSFLVSTPSTGVDSIAATWGMMGLPFTILRSMFSVIAGLFSGSGLNAISSNTEVETPTFEEKEEPETRSFGKKVKAALHYGLVELVLDAQKWLLIGLGLGALIGWLIPDTFFEEYFGSLAASYLIMVMIGLPMYVCATGSIPIAAAFVAKGISPGAALIFLTLGPVTNTATMSFVWDKMGKKPLVMYLTVISGLSILMALCVDLFFKGWVSFDAMTHYHESIPIWKQIFAGLLILLIVKNWIPRFTPKPKGDIMKFSIPQITCNGCKMSVEGVLSKVKGVDGFDVSVEDKTAELSGDFDEKDVVEGLQNINFTATKIL